LSQKVLVRDGWHTLLINLTH